MPIPLKYLAGMWFRKTPIGPMRRAVHRADAAGLTPPLEHLESHALAGGNVERVVHAMVQARDRDLETTWEEVSAIDLAGHDPVAAVAKAAEPRTVTLATIRADRPRPIEAQCRGGDRVGARIDVRYHLGLGAAVFGESVAFPLHDLFALEAMAAIADAPDLATLRAEHAELATRLAAWGRDRHIPVDAVTIAFGPT